MNTTKKGDLFESRVFEIINRSLSDGSFGFLPECCRVLKKPRYFSKDRESDIVFDLSIEVWPAGAERCHVLYLIECKDYEHVVPADDVEEFIMKVRQVAGEYVKAVFVTTNKLQKSALTLAKNRGLMLIHVDKEIDNVNIILHNKSRKRNILVDNPTYFSINQAKKLQEIGNLVDKRITPDLDKLIEDFLSGQLNFRPYWDELGKPVEGLEYLSKEIIDNITTNIIEEFDNSIITSYKPFPLARFIDYMQETHGVSIMKDQPMSSDKRHLNGYYDRSNRIIYINPEIVDSGSYAFVCAHEIAHHFLHEHLRISQELYDAQNDSVYDPMTKRHLLECEKHWIEWQANQFAVSLIMPRKSILGQLILWQVEHGVRNRGSIYVDDDPDNILLFKKVITQLAFKFQVSCVILENRLRDLGIIKYNTKRKQSFGSNYRNQDAKSVSEILKSYFK